MAGKDYTSFAHQSSMLNTSQRSEVRKDKQESDLVHLFRPKANMNSSVKPTFVNSPDPKLVFPRIKNYNETTEVEPKTIESHSSGLATLEKVSELGTNRVLPPVLDSSGQIERSDGFIQSCDQI